MALSSGGATALAGSPGKTVGGVSSQGAAYLFTRPGSGWGQTTSPSKLQETSEITASDGADAAFGRSVALAGNGATVLGGAPVTVNGTANVLIGTVPTSGGGGGGAIGLWALLGLLGLGGLAHWTDGRRTHV